jgi:MFS family permease
MVADAAHSRPAVARMLLGILFCASILNTTDRAMLNFLVDPIRHDLHISDVQISLLQGLSFSIFYAIAGLPLGYAADRMSRTRLLTWGIALWSGATVLSGLAPSYGWLFAARMVVGCGEATLPPCALSLIADSFNPAQRGRALGFYLLGGAVSTGLAGLLVAWILVNAPRGAFDFIPGAAGAPPWRIAMVAAGAAGRGVALALALQREPARHGASLGASLGVTGKPAWRQVARYLRTNAGVFVPLYAGFAAFSVAAYGTIAWAAPLLMRQFALSPKTAGQNLGLTFVVAGIAGAILAGQIIDRRYVLRHRPAKLTMLMILPLCMLPAAAATLAPDATVATLQLALMIMLGPMATIVMLAVLAEMMPNDMRAVAVALLGIAGTMIGAVLGPLLIAECTQRVFQDPLLVGRASLLVATPFLLLSSACFALCRAALGRSLGLRSSLSQVMDADRPVAIDQT